MRGIRKLRWLGAALLALAGCQSTEVELKPTHQREDYVVPEDGDPRFEAREGMKYPKGTLFSDILDKDTVTANDPSKTNNRFGAGGPGGMRPGM